MSLFSSGAEHSFIQFSAPGADGESVVGVVFVPNIINHESAISEARRIVIANKTEYGLRVDATTGDLNILECSSLIEPRIPSMF